jgi:hypothetical protein
MKPAWVAVDRTRRRSKGGSRKRAERLIRLLELLCVRALARAAADTDDVDDEVRR